MTFLTQIARVGRLARILIIVGAVLCGWRVAAASLKSDETVVLYPGIVWETKDGWAFEIQGLVYELEPAGHTAQWLRKLAGVDENDLTAEERRIYQDRIRYFLADNERGKSLILRFGTNVFRMSTTVASGRFEGVFNLRDRAWPERELAPINGQARRTAWIGDGERWRAVELEVHVVRSNGWSVISDIDDTIKISQVRDRSALLKGTFFQPFKPAPGMAALYQEWLGEISPQFHYLSASPGQLFVPLQEFMTSQQFPRGTFHLKPFRLKDSNVRQILGPQTGYKSGVIGKVLQRFPERRFVLVGDSGEQDPEIYGSAARKFPRQVARILIRNVTREPRSAPRYQQAFAGLPSEMWEVFDHPADLDPSKRRIDGVASPRD